MTIKQKENALRDARDNLLKYSIYASINAVVTKLDINLGEIVSANNPVVAIISHNKFDLETNIPESDIAKIKIGNQANITLDAYGRDIPFKGQVVSIDPAETMIEGVATYKVTLQFVGNDERIKSGMTANIDILTGQKNNVLVVSQRSIIRKDGQKFVQVVDGSTMKEVKVETGLQGSDGNIEITHGLTEGDKVVTFIE